MLSTQQTGAASAGQRPARRNAIAAVSHGIAIVEGRAAGALIFLIFVLLLTNVVCRTAGVPLIWADELAVLLMAWVAFIGASMGLANHQHIAVTLLPDALGAAARRRFALCVDLVLLAFFVLLAMLFWNWFDPVGLLGAGSLEDFSTTTFNFIYQEPTITLGVSKFWFWLILPLFCVTSVIHILASLITTLHMPAEALS